MKRALIVMCAGLWVSCQVRQDANLHELSSFKVDVRGVFVNTGTTRTPLTVVTACARKYGGQAMVPAEARGTPGCKYDIPRGEIEIDLVASALNLKGEVMTSFNNPVAFRVVPGDLASNYATRWGQAQDGKVLATVRSLHQYGKVRVWVEDAPPKPIFDGGEQVVGTLPDEPDSGRTYAAGASDIVYFDEQTLQSLQLPDGFDNRSSPFVGEFVTVGKNPESGESLLQSCSDDPTHDGQPALMVVTGLDPAGFFVSDISACRLVEKTADATGTQVRTPQLPESCYANLADGGVQPIETTDAGTGTCAISRGSCRSSSECKRYLPGTFASMFVYNYNFPDGLDQGDLIFTLSGSVQEFTSTTQMVFPGWTVAEHVRQLPVDQWDKWLKYSPPVDIGGRICGWDDVPDAFITDALCGHNKRNLKMESLESALVRLRGIRFPSAYENCDFDSNGSVPFFCEQKDPNGAWIWGSCAFGEVERENDTRERECTQACVLGYGKHAGEICTEGSTFKGFGQYVVELGQPGLRSAGLDDSLPQRYKTLQLTAGGSAKLGGFGQGSEVAVACDRDTHFRAGDDAVAATNTDRIVKANTWVSVKFAAGQTSVGLLSGGAAATCTVGLDIHARLNLMTKDAIPELSPDCSRTDPDPARAAQCTALLAASFDVVGHLRHVQPARPRWMVVPRDADDVCCHPGEGLSCPRPIKPCPN